MFLKNQEHFLFINIHFLFLFLATDIYNQFKKWRTNVKAVFKKIKKIL